MVIPNKQQLAICLEKKNILIKLIYSWHKLSFFAVLIIFSSLLFLPTITIANSKSDSDVLTLVDYATQGDFSNVIRLLELGIDPNLASMKHNGATGLMVASQNGYIDIANAFLDAGANTNKKMPKSGTTALMFAAQNEHLDIIKLLLKNKADPNQEAFDGKQHSQLR